MPEVPPVLLCYIDGLRTHDVARIAGTVADNLRFISAARTLDKSQFLAMLTAIYTALPDWDYDHDPPELQPDGSIRILWRQSGRHTGPLALPGLPQIAATGKQVRIPPQYFCYRVADGLICEIRPDPTPGGAPGGILEQIGAVPGTL